jgi:hypothetical protein
LALDIEAIFTRYGVLVGTLNRADSYHGGDIPSRSLAVESAYSGRAELLSSLASAREAATRSGSSWASFLAQLASGDLVDAVDSDNPQPDLSPRTASAEFLRQMNEQGHSVAPLDLGLTFTASSLNHGKLNWVGSTRTPDGAEAVYCFAEDLVASVVADGQAGGGATAGNERVSIAGQYTKSSPLDPTYPQGSATRTGVTVVDPADNARGGYGNLLRNGSFNVWEAESSDLSEYVPSYWTPRVGTVGVAIFEDDDSGYNDSSAMTFLSDGSTSITVYQQFNSSTGTPVVLEPLQQFAVLARIRTTTAPLTGELRVALVDGSNNVTTDQSGRPNSVSIPLSEVASDWGIARAVFRTPAELSSAYRLEFRLTTPPANGKLLLIDHVAMARMVQLYQPGGPSVAAFSTLDQVIKNDTWTLRVTSTSSNKSWHRAFDRLLGWRQMGLVLPTSLSPTISSELIDFPPGATQPGESSSGGPGELSSGWGEEPDSQEWEPEPEPEDP